MSGDRWPDDLGQGARDRNVRAADTDREVTVERLRREHLQGRLDEEELQERIERALAAKTYADLDELVSDLPREQPQPIPGPTRSRRVWRPVALLLLLAVLAVASSGRLLWIAIPAFFLIMRPMMWCSGFRPYRTRVRA